MVARKMPPLVPVRHAADPHPLPLLPAGPFFGDELEGEMELLTERRELRRRGELMLPVAERRSRRASGGGDKRAHAPGGRVARATNAHAPGGGERWHPAASLQLPPQGQHRVREHSC